jgi:hypothetical protein
VTYPARHVGRARRRSIGGTLLGVSGLRARAGAGGAARLLTDAATVHGVLHNARWSAKPSDVGSYIRAQVDRDYFRQTKA